MKLNYYPETDSLYIDLSSTPSAESKEIADGVVVDFDDAGRIVGIDIEQASNILSSSELQSHTVPIEIHKLRA